MIAAPTEAFGPYLVYEKLGVGGMAQVHRAEVNSDEGFHRPVALKRMLPHVAADLEMVQAFVREAHLASHLRHANVAQTYELGKVGETYFIAMELVEGRDLREVLKHAAGTTGPMPVSVALNILNQLCDALDYAHNLCDDSGRHLGLIHRDVSPSNLIVAEGGVLKLIDFGIAKAAGVGMQTQSGVVKGKFAYMAPEYIAGRIDARADLFGVGVIAWELLTNRPLFAGRDDIDTLERVRAMPIKPPSHHNSDVPGEVDDIVMTALARDPDQRWQHATALRTAMTTVTQRLGLVISNAQVLEWIEWAFDLTKPRGGPIRRRSEDEDPSIDIQRPATELPDHLDDQSTPLTASMSGQITMMMVDPGRPPAPLVHSPLGTPKSFEAPHPNPPQFIPRHEAMAPNTGRMSDQIIPTLVRERPSIPRFAPPADLAPPRPRSTLLLVVLVLVVAVVAAATVYFVLPLVS
ncbi:MAG TPA: serine/threonine-protein kinase [Kofleriaceae bacterium]